MMDESTVLNNLRTAHYGDWGVDLSSQDVHELWGEIETRDKRVTELEAFEKIVNDCGFDVVTDVAILGYPERKVLAGHGMIYVPVEGA